MPPITFEGGCDHKVIGGKLLRARVSIIFGEKGPELVKVRLFGDFFMHPEEGVERLEASILSTGLDEGSMRTAVEGFLAGGDVELLGASAQDVSMALGNAVKDALLKMAVRDPSNTGSP